jgi:putative restriction endonuclease
MTLSDSCWTGWTSGPASNHVQNGLLLTSEFHTLFDRGLVGIEPPRPGRETYRLRVSGQLRELWNNGHRYYGFEGQELVVPRDPAQRPSREALQWHLDSRFEKGLG